MMGKMKEIRSKRNIEEVMEFLWRRGEKSV